MDFRGGGLFELTETASYEVDGVVVREVHGRPPQPHGVKHVDGEQLGEDVTHKQGLESGPARVQGREGTENHGRGVESRGVEIDTEERIDGLETGGITGDGVVGGCQSVRVLVPGRRAGEDDLDYDGRHVHVAESAGPDGGGAGRAPDEHASGDDDGRDVVNDAVGDPGQQVQDDVLVGGHDVAQVGAIEDVLEGREHADPDGGAVVGGDVFAARE